MPMATVLLVDDLELIIEFPDGVVLPMEGKVKRAEEGAEEGMGPTSSVPILRA